MSLAASPDFGTLRAFGDKLDEDLGAGGFADHRRRGHREGPNSTNELGAPVVMTTCLRLRRRCRLSHSIWVSLHSQVCPGSDDKYVAGSARRSAAIVVANVTDRIRVRLERLPAIDVWLASKASSE
jgi:hypothetical protein